MKLQGVECATLGPYVADRWFSWKGVVYGYQEGQSHCNEKLLAPRRREIRGGGLLVRRHVTDSARADGCCD
jgi:hypothetical protein